MLQALAMLALLAFALPVAAQSLGEVAREQRNTPRPHAKHVYTNDDFPSVPPPPPPATDKATPADKGTTPEGGNAQGDKPAPEDALQKKIKNLRTQIAELEKKVQGLQTEERERASAYYGDVGVELRQPEKWNTEMQQIRDDIAAAQKELADKRTELSDAEEQQRKANQHAY